jgi:hypothetical protein
MRKAETVMRGLVLGVAMVGTSCSHGVGAPGSSSGKSVVIGQGGETFATAGVVERGPFDVSKFSQLRIHVSSGCEGTAVAGHVAQDGSFVPSGASQSNNDSTTPGSVMLQIQSTAPGQATCAWQFVGKVAS